MKASKIARSAIVLETHCQIYSASQALRDFLRKEGCLNLLYISHPLPLKGIHRDDTSFFESSSGDKILGKGTGVVRFSNIILSSLWETVFSIWWVIKSGKTFDVFIGVDNLNALHGLFLKRIGRVKKVVYYTIDYFPTRFGNKFLNDAYHAIDKFCVRFADETWNVSPMMVHAREEHNGMDRRVYRRQFTVPIGIWFDKAPRKSFEQINQQKLVFAGHLVPHMGVDIVLQALPLIIKRIPEIHLDIIGGGEEEGQLKRLTASLKLGKHVTFYGWVKDRSYLEDLLSRGAVGMATFNTDILDAKVRNADPGKIKDYMSLGMPVIATNAISTARDITKNQCGIIVPYTAKAVAHAVVTLLSSKQTLKGYREHALAYVRQFDYNKVFNKALKRVLAS